MESYYSSSSSSSTYLTQNPQANNPKKFTTQPSHASLRTVRKLSSKPWKKPIAPLPPPARPRVYKVEPKNFRELVQRLTGADELQCRRLQSVAPPPLNVNSIVPPLSAGGSVQVPPKLVSPLALQTPLSALYQKLVSEETIDTKAQKLSDCLGASNSFGLGLSPSANSWFSFAFLSPGTLSSLEQSTVL